MRNCKRADTISPVIKRYTSSWCSAMPSEPACMCELSSADKCADRSVLLIAAPLRAYSSCLSILCELSVRQTAQQAEAAPVHHPVQRHNVFFAFCFLKIEVHLRSVSGGSSPHDKQTTYFPELEFPK